MSPNSENKITDLMLEEVLEEILTDGHSVSWDQACRLPHTDGITPENPSEDEDSAEIRD